MEGEGAEVGRLGGKNAGRLGSWKAGRLGGKVVVIWGEHERGTTPALLMAPNGLKINHDHIASFWKALILVHQLSSPTGTPQSVSGWILVSVTPDSS